MKRLDVLKLAFYAAVSLVILDSDCWGSSLASAQGLKPALHQPGTPRPAKRRVNYLELDQAPALAAEQEVPAWKKEERERVVSKRIYRALTDPEAEAFVQSKLQDAQGRFNAFYQESSDDTSLPLRKRIRLRPTRSLGWPSLDSSSIAVPSEAQEREEKLRAVKDILFFDKTEPPAEYVASLGEDQSEGELLLDAQERAERFRKARRVAPFIKLSGMKIKDLSQVLQGYLQHLETAYTLEFATLLAFMTQKLIQEGFITDLDLASKDYLTQRDALNQLGAFHPQVFKDLLQDFLEEYEYEIPTVEINPTS